MEAAFLGDRTRSFLHIGEAKPLVLETSARREFRHGDQVGLTMDPCGLIASRLWKSGAARAAASLFPLWGSGIQLHFALW